MKLSRKLSSLRFRGPAAHVLGLSGVVLCTLLLHLAPWERRLDNSALPYLAVILAAGLLGGPAPGVVTAVASFLFYMDYVFVPAHYTFTLADPVDVIATIGFLGLSGFVAYLLHRSQAEAETARRREHEARTIAEMIQVVDRDDGLQPMLESVAAWTVRNLDVDYCAALLPDASGHLQAVASAASSSHIQTGETKGQVDAERVLASGSPCWRSEGDLQHGHLPLLGGGQAIGVFEIVTRSDIQSASGEQERLCMALVHQVGHAVERARLREVSTEAEIFRRSDELKSALLATVSHELGTPLAVIRAAARTLEGGEVSENPSVERELAAMIHREADRLRGLVTDLLDVSRIDGGALRLSLGWYDLGELVRESVARLRPGLQGRVVEIDAPGELPVEVDYVLLQRVIDNLVENAIRHAPADQPVRIGVRPAGACLEVVVSDEGPGIPSDHLDRVFHKFHQVEGRSGGAGLGLAICKGIVEEHQGRIWAESPINDGRGLAVHFTVPWVPISAPQSA